MLLQKIEAHYVDHAHLAAPKSACTLNLYRNLTAYFQVAQHLYQQEAKPIEKL